MAIGDYIRDIDAKAFIGAARQFRVSIGVRKTNAESLAYVGKPGYSPKMFDCKAKTADFNVNIGGREYKTAGLVADPTVVGPSAYPPGKYDKAMKIWNSFQYFVATDIQDADGKPRSLYMPNGKRYGVERNRDSDHYGCLFWSRYGSAVNGAYVHGDYDLYAIVPDDDPTRTVAAFDDWSNTPLWQAPPGYDAHKMVHARGRELTDVQIWINREIGFPMVRHGDQEKFSDHTDEDVLFFFSDGTTTEVHGVAGLDALYRGRFAGRRTGHVPDQVPYGRFGRVER